MDELEEIGDEVQKPVCELSDFVTTQQKIPMSKPHKGTLYFVLDGQNNYAFWHPKKPLSKAQMKKKGKGDKSGKNT